MVLDVERHVLALIARGECDAAADVLARLIARSPRDASLLATRALLLADVGRMDEALEVAGSASALDVDLAYAQWAHAIVRIRNGEFRRALPLARRAVALDPAEPKHLIALAWAEAGEARWRDALLCLEQALAFEPDLDEARALRALVLEQQGRAMEASPDFRRLLQREPENAFARAGEAWVQLHAGGIDHTADGEDTQRRARRATPVTRDIARRFRALLDAVLPTDVVARTGLTPERLHAGNGLLWALVTITAFAAGIALAGTRGPALAVFLFGTALLPLAATHPHGPGRPRNLLGGVTAAVAGSGVVILLLPASAAAPLFGTGVLSALIGSWLAQGTADQVPNS